MMAAMWIAPEPTPPPEEPLVGSDRAILTAFLDWQRYTLLHICAGLTSSQLALRPIASTSISLLGLVRHLAKVERIWLRERVAGVSIERLFMGDDDYLNPENQSAADAFEVYQAETRAGDDAVRALPFDHTFTLRGQEHSLRLVYAHLNTEYARHNGHADLIREAIDGVRGR
jgi:uncharacterized damage-inducible protein DinB